MQSLKEIFANNLIVREVLVFCAQNASLKPSPSSFFLTNKWVFLSPFTTQHE